MVRTRVAFLGTATAGRSRGRRWAPGQAAVAVLALLLAGCSGQGGSDPMGSDDEAGEDAPREGRTPPQGPVPLLAPGSAFQAQAWGFLRSDWSPPALALPTVLIMDGYEGASAVGLPTHYVRMQDGALIALTASANEEYLFFRGSVRGSGCSGGAFELFGQTQAWDGHELIEWLATQPWSTGKVGLRGGSYNGMMAVLIAATAPPSLAAVSANMLVADIYRDLSAPGGVPNDKFPRLWTYGYRSFGDVHGSAIGIQGHDEVCAQNVASRPVPDPLAQERLHMLRGTDNSWYRDHSLITHAGKIRAPISISHAWQDEQTGGRGGPVLFEAFHPDPVLIEGEWIEPKRMHATNGLHWTAATFADDNRWMDHWLRGNDTGLLREPPVLLAFGGRGNADWSFDADALLPLDAFPSSATNWTRMHLHPDGMIRALAPQRDASLDYVSGTSTQGWVRSGYAGQPGADLDPLQTPVPESLVFRTEAVQDAVVFAGPLAATLWLSTTATDTDLYLVVSDAGPDGVTYELMRGILRASHRALDETHSRYNEAGDIIRPHHPHTDPAWVVPGRVERYDIEISPGAHIIHPGHALELRITTPPVIAGLQGYDTVRQPGVNTLHMGTERPSSILLPVIQWPGAMPEAWACGAPDGYRCVA